MFQIFNWRLIFSLPHLNIENAIYCTQIDRQQNELKNRVLYWTWTQFWKSSVLTITIQFQNTTKVLTDANAAKIASGN